MEWDGMGWDGMGLGTLSCVCVCWGVLGWGKGEGRKEGGRGGVYIQFQEVELGFLGDDLVDVGGEEGVGLADFGPDGALDGGFDFGLCAGGDAGWGKTYSLAGVFYVWLVFFGGFFLGTCSFLNMLKCVLCVELVWFGRRRLVGRCGGMDAFGAGGDVPGDCP